MKRGSGKSHGALNFAEIELKTMNRVQAIECSYITKLLLKLIRITKKKNPLVLKLIYLVGERFHNADTHFLLAVSINFKLLAPKIESS